MQPVFHLTGVRKSYAGRLILDIDQLDILPGEILAVVGPSGAGKSTLLRLLNFLESADTGCLEYHGQSINAKPPLDLRRQVTTVFQRPALLNASVESNVACGLRLRGERDGHGAVTQALERMGLEKLARSPARTLSGGEMQRVALARALVIRPRVLLLDEPTANLDPYNVGLIEEVIRETNQQSGTSMVLVTHNVFQARRLAGRAALMLNGQIIELCEAAAFFESPQDPRTRAFIRGDMVY